MYTFFAAEADTVSFNGPFVLFQPKVERIINLYFAYNQTQLMLCFYKGLFTLYDIKESLITYVFASCRLEIIGYV